MNEKEIKQLRLTLSNYKQKKNELRNNREALRQDVREGKRYSYNVDEILIPQIYREFEETPERKAFLALIERVNKDDEYEANFRKMFIEIFL